MGSVQKLHFEKDKINQFLNHAHHYPYSFACWKIPQENNLQTIIDLTPVSRLSTKDICTSVKGFIVNLFKDHHPSLPFFIKPKISFISTDDNVTVSTDTPYESLKKFYDTIHANHFYARADKKEYIKGDFSKIFEKKVAFAIKKIKQKTVDKVVLSRYVDVHLPENFDIMDFFEKIYTHYPNSFCSLFFIPNYGYWLGASPELLLYNDPYQFKTVALAATQQVLNTHQKLNDITWTQKEIEEQALVSRYIVNCFKKLRLREFHEHGPKTIQVGNLAHLKTSFEVYYREIEYKNITAQMLDLLHPTSAVCGMPFKEALEFIKKNEEYDRLFYSGYLGPIGYNNTIQLFVNLRCLNIQEDHIRLFAGAGITEDSLPQKEFIETQLKMNVLGKFIKH